MSKANQVFGTLSGAPGAGALGWWTPFVLLALCLAAAGWMAAGLPKVVEGQDQAPLWSAQISVTDLENGAVGAVQGTDFSNQGGSAGLTAKWLYHYEHDGKLRLSFTEGADVEGHVLQVGHLTLAFPDNTSGNNSFTWQNVEVDWEQGDALAARIVETTDGNTPPTGLPQITGRPQVTEVLTADASGIVDADGLDSATFAYQWQSGGTDVALATNSEYTPTAPDQGKVITVKVSFEDDGGTAESITSRPTAPVLAANSKATGMPTISGTPQVWRALSADISTIDDQDGITNVSFSYQWASDDGNGPADIEGATGSTFTPTASEVGHTVQVRVTFTDDAGNTEELTSAATLTVAEGPPPVPTISSVIREHIGMLRVDWDDVHGATGYEISYLHHHITWITLPNAEFNYDAHFNGSKALVDGLVDRSNYSFRVRSLNAFGPSDWSEQFSNGFSGFETYGVTTDPRPRIPGSPSEPRDLSATLSQHLKIHLSWTEPEEQGDSDVTGYRIEYQIRGSKMWNYLGTTPDTAWTHTGLSPGRKFYYRVSAFNDHGRGRNSTRSRGASFYDPQQGRWQPEVHKVKDDWELLPDGVDWQHGDRFRLMFITSDSRDVHSPNIGDYNEFVQDAAANGHDAVQKYSAGFRVLASTAAVDAVDNTGTHRTKEDPGLPVYWLEGTRVADNYADLYDGEWDDPRFSAEVRTVSHTYFDDQKGLVTVLEPMAFWSFDADRGEYIYTSEHGESMYGKHCHGYSWQTWDYSIGDFDDNQIDLLPCIATGSNNNGRVHHSEYLDRCGFHNSLGGLCYEVAIGRPTRVLPEEEGDARPLVDINPTLNFRPRSTQPDYLVTSTSGPTNATVTLKDISTGRITYTFLFYALSPIFEVEADPALSVADAETVEAEGATLDFTVALHPAAAAEVTVDYATQDGTATAGSDYTSTSGTLTFAAGDTTKTVSVPITDDTAEDDGETFKLVLSNASGAEIADAEATGTIRNTETNSAPTGLPTVTGTPQVGVPLTADTSAIDDADGLDDVSWQYQWIVNDGNSDADIEEGTGSTYTPSPSDVGKTIKVKVSFTDDADNEETLTSEATVAVAATVPTAPQSLTVTQGSQDQQLDVSWQAPSSNGGSDVTGYRVQWKEAADSWDTAADVSEASETGTTHTITSLTGGVEYAVRVIATNSAGDGPASTEAKGTPTGGVSEQAVEPENSAPTGLPTISGTPQVDQALTADTSPIDDEDGLTNVSYEYQWIAGGSDIDGATGSTYTLTSSDQGQTIQVKVAFTDDRNNAETLTSIATVAVAAAPNREATGKPAIGGTPQVGQTLTADTSPIGDEDGLTSVSYSYQWIAEGSDIAGATGAAYTLNASELGQTIQVRVTFTDDRNNDETLTSIATAAVLAAPVPLTVSVTVSAPASHDGSSEFTFEIEFSEEFGLSYRTLKFHAFNVTGGSVERAQRTDKPSNIPWRITVKPQGAGDVTIELPATTNCGANGAICTGDGRKLSNSLNITVSGLGQ